MLNLDEIKSYLTLNRIQWKEGEKMSLHTTFRIGGPAALFIEPCDEAQLSGLLHFLHGLQAEPVVVGRGSNLLVADSGIDRPVICMGDSFSQINIVDRPCEDGKTVVFAQSGASLTKLCRFCQENGLSGLEFAYGIPGTVGGAIYMNAGAYGGEMKDVVVGADYVTEDGTCRSAEAAELDFSYRHSCFTAMDYCITGGYFALTPGDKEAILSAMEENMHKRITKQPLDYPSAGSTFKRPVDNYASALIDRCGLKGFSVGGAQVSPKHAGFVINAGGATAKDVLELCEQVAAEVKKQTGYTLEKEIKLL